MSRGTPVCGQHWFSDMSAATLAERLKAQAQQLGFELVGIAPATEADDYDHYLAWLAQGYAGEMHYLERQAAARRHPAALLPGVRSVIMVALSYKPATEPAPGTARISRYAQGKDYHEVLRERLRALLGWLQEQAPGCRGRVVVDTAPLLERAFARRAGLGWIGKNTLLLHRRWGSYLFLGALLVDIDLPPDAPEWRNYCGRCTACLEACPTQAFVAPGQLDARRCLSYLTIELRGPVPEELRPALGDWLFGCDICQEVCPWNRKAPPGREPALQPQAELVALDPAELLRLSEEEFRRRFRHTALWRARRAGLLRNAALVLGNRGSAEALPVLQQALTDPEPLVRDAAAWAIARLRERLAPASPPPAAAATSSPEQPPAAGVVAP